ncbi:MAG: methyltransferase [Desulfamplus sp.]|nr:methyltransferase [Desulfamplus sp.]
MFSLDAFKKEYDIELTTFALADRTLNLYVPKTIDRFINKDKPFEGFPLWAKIWEATAVLALHLSSIPPDPDRRIMEIGAGMGVAGIYAASLGHRVTITEYNRDALNFARANALENGIHDVDILSLDWRVPHPMGKFDRIIGSEVVFREADITTLLSVFKLYLLPGGTITLAEGMRKTSLDFVRVMEKHYSVRLKKQTVKSAKEDIPVVLIEMSE